MISAIAVTFGRSGPLQEALACYLSQDYTGEREMIVLNTCPEQTLIGDFPHVRIVNLTTRPASLGIARNCAIALAREDSIILNFVDDDFMLPHCLSLYAEQFDDEAIEWVHVVPTFYSEAWKIKGVFSTWVNSCSFRKSAWRKAGEYPQGLSVGEDRDFFSRLSSKCVGRKVEIAPKEIPFIYNWGNQVWHLSGQGDDKPGAIKAYDRSRIDLISRFASGKEPRGKIELLPQFTHDPSVMVKQYIGVKKADAQNHKIVIVQLGRFGDIINILPICQHIHNTFAKPHLMVSREFASMLEGVSYVTPFPVDFSNDQLLPALTLAKREFPIVLQTQIWGKGWNQERKTEAYNMESWRMAGMLHRFSDSGMMPLFDCRDKEREGAIVSKLVTGDKPFILVSLTKNISSPFLGGAQVLAEITKSFSEYYQIIDVASLRLHRIYDLLGLIERAYCVVSSDTALLHLTAATTTPLVALVNPKPWLGSAPRGNCIDRITYDQANSKPEWVTDEISCAGQRVKPQQKSSVVTAGTRKIYHVVERHPDNSPRKVRARKTWEAIYKSGAMIPCHYWDYKRNARDIGDPRALPYLKDLLAMGMEKSNDDDLICWSNDDNHLHPRLPNELLFRVPVYGPVMSHRLEYDGMVPLPPQAGYPIHGTRAHMGRDLFAATKRWLREHWDEIPDFLLAASDFDLCLACMIRLNYGIVSNRRNLETPMLPADLPLGFVAHEAHAAKWSQPSNVDSAPSQIWNRSLFRAWSSLHLPTLKFSPKNTI